MDVQARDPLSRKWLPCTGNLTIGRYLERLRFPISFRGLVYRWMDLGRPQLRSMRIPLDLSLMARDVPTTSSGPTIQQITEKQEKNVIDALNRYCTDGTTLVPRYFNQFASYLDIYCALDVELTVMEQRGLGHLDQELLYISKRDELLTSFELDREMCVCGESHKCLGYCLWGEMYHWTESDIRQQFSAYKRRSPSFSMPQPSRTCSSSSSVRNAATPTAYSSPTTPRESSSPATSVQSILDSEPIGEQTPVSEEEVDEWRLVIPGCGTAIPFSMSALSNIARAKCEGRSKGDEYDIQITPDLINFVSWEQAFAILRNLPSVRPRAVDAL